MNNRLRYATAAITAIVLFLVCAATALPAQTQCPQHYYAGMAPDIANQQLSQKARELCFSAFGIVHSGISRTPLWSAEHLTRAQVESAKSLDRVNSFHPEPRLPVSERAELSDYSRSGYDRGHLSPNGDMPDRTAQQESFSLANIIPQDPLCNRNIFQWTEASVRRYTMKVGELYVITGPLFIGENIGQLNNRVLIPTHIYKALYNPREKRGGAYLVKNEPGNNYEKITIAKLEQLAGIIFFPNMTNSEKQKMLELPTPSPGSGSAHNKKAKSTKGMMQWLFR